MSTNHDIEEGTALCLDFDKLKKLADITANVIPAVIQDARTLQVLMLGYMNREALSATLKTKVVTFWSTSRNELWIKGLTSGNRLLTDKLFVNCEQNSLLITATPEKGGACHTLSPSGEHRQSCYYRQIVSESALQKAFETL